MTPTCWSETGQCVNHGACNAADRCIRQPPASSVPPGVAPSPATLDAVCQHGTAMDVHCCNCHGGFLFDSTSCVCVLEGASEDRALNGDDLADIGRRIADGARQWLEAHDRTWCHLPSFRQAVITQAALYLKTIVQHERQLAASDSPPVGTADQEAWMTRRGVCLLHGCIYRTHADRCDYCDEPKPSPVLYGKSPISGTPSLETAVRFEIVKFGVAVYQGPDSLVYQCPSCLRNLFSQDTIGQPATRVICHGPLEDHRLEWDG